jgi:cellulose biosynthesis protein BcsQ
MAKIICLFNHKGGVSKTTTAFNLGWKMANMGAKVLMADFDPQCNLTGMVMGFDGIDDLEAIYCNNPANNVRDALSPAFEAKPKQIEAAECTPVKGNANLFLLAGHIGLSEYETTLGVAQELSGSLLPLRNLPGSLRFMLDETANKIGADYVIVDMSPSLGLPGAAAPGLLLVDGAQLTRTYSAALEGLGSHCPRHRCSEQRRLSFSEA